MNSVNTRIYRLIVLVVTLAMLAVSIPISLAQGAVSDAQVVTSYLNMRANPSTESPLVKQLSYGTLLTAQGRNEDGSWLYVNTADGVAGWVKTSWVAVRLDMDIMALPVTNASGSAASAAAPAAVSAPAAASVPLSGTTASVVTRVNIRTGPGTQHGRLGTLALGVQIGLQGRDNAGEWVYGTTNTGITGWVAARYLDANLATVSGLPVMDASAPTGGSAAPAAAAAAPAQSAAPPPPVAAPSSGSGFMLGGQVADFSQQGWMQSAGMTWVKRQVVYNNGANPGDQAGLIADAHNRGFRILVSVKGHPGDLASDPNYINNFAGYLGGLAGLGADAIEVWNEMNIDREWPAGRIDPNWYVQMLAASYNAIKSRNGGTMVVSGAPAPTGAEGAFGLDRVWNDDRYVRGMAAAGAARYMDCIGIHYNEGIISPNQRSGDPRGGHYTRYFWGMVDLYWGAFGGQRPLCFTEIGYLSPEGYGGLPGSFAWAGSTSVAQQAQWLADSARLARSSGRVRLFIVWNVDFTGRWGDDPMGGYAIVRPNGDCPACRSLAGIW